MGLKKAGPEGLIGDDDGAPRLGSEAELGGVVGGQESQDLHQYVVGERVE